MEREEKQQAARQGKTRQPASRAVLGKERDGPEKGTGPLGGWGLKDGMAMMPPLSSEQRSIGPFPLGAA